MIEDTDTLITNSFLVNILLLIKIGKLLKLRKKFSLLIYFFIFFNSVIIFIKSIYLQITFK